MIRHPRPAAALGAVAFVLRCSVSAALSFSAAEALALGHPVWAVVSTLVVSQESVDQTHYTLRWRAIGTVIGAAVATGWMTALSRDVDHQIMAMTLAVATCAAIARRWPLLRVAMWTAAMVTLTASPEHSVVQTAIERASEVLLGGAAGAVVHVLIDQLLLAARATDR